MIILGIETSCDDTAVAVLEAKGRKTPRFKILANIVSSQVKLHQKYGGVYPSLAKREHQKNLPIVLNRALRKAKLPIFNLQFSIYNQFSKSNFQFPKIDLIAVTAGPGLEPCLWTGINFAKELAKKRKVQLIPVNHIEAHILVNFLNTRYKIQNTKYKNFFPAVCLVVSGGHTQLILMKKIGRYKIIGETRDDAAGECFDKTARILGLPYPGGPAIAAKATKYKIQDTPNQSKHGTGQARYKIQLPRPMMYSKDYDFSFGGLKTAVLYHHQNQPPKIKKTKQYIQTMCLEIQQAIIDVLIHKTIRAAKDFKARSIILGGGVCANQELRKQLKEKIKKETPKAKYLVPDTQYCTDNAVMIAATGYFQWLKNKKVKPESVEAQANLRLQ